MRDTICLKWDAALLEISVGCRMSFSGDDACPRVALPTEIFSTLSYHTKHSIITQNHLKTVLNKNSSEFFRLPGMASLSSSAFPLVFRFQDRIQLIPFAVFHSYSHEWLESLALSVVQIRWVLKVFAWRPTEADKDELVKYS